MTSDRVTSTGGDAAVPTASPDDVPAARAALYALAVDLFAEPDAQFHAALRDDGVDATVRELFDAADFGVEPPTLRTDDDHETLRARYNDLFVVGDPEPPVSLYESSHREDVSWNDVNIDLARAYEYYGLEIDGTDREHHDHLRHLLEFASYLARREALGDDGAARARADFLDRHLEVIASGIRAALDDEQETGLYDAAGAFLVALVGADDPLERIDEGGDGALDHDDATADDSPEDDDVATDDSPEDDEADADDSPEDDDAAADDPPGYAADSTSAEEVPDDE